MKNSKLNRGLLRGVTGIAARIPDRTFLSLVKPQVDLIQYPDARDFINLLLLNFKHQYSRLAPTVRKRFVENLFGNAMLFASGKITSFTQSYGFVPPSLTVISPTFRCNLKCYGCYSANYAQNDVLDFDTIDRILTEGKEYGMYFAVITGGEPFIRRDMMKIFDKHSDMVFQVYTNGVYIEKDGLAKDIVRLGNIIPCFSVEGYEEQTDARRGKGVFRTVMSLMDELNALGGLYGYSATATRENNELIVSDEFVDFFEKKGCYVGWYFNYMPVGRSPALDLMPTPQQRDYRGKRIRELRKTRQLPIVDFWMDGTVAGSQGHACLAGGRGYFHVTASGDVDPCVFVQYHTDNILNKKVIDVLRSPFFTAIRKRQEEYTNLLRPCMVIDRPQVLRDVVASNGAVPSQGGGWDTVTTLGPQLDAYAREYEKIATQIWDNEYKGPKETGTEHHIGQGTAEEYVKLFGDRVKRKKTAVV